MEALRFIKIIFIFSISLLVIFLISCQSPLFQTEYNAQNDLAEQSEYYGQYVSKKNVGNNANENLNVFLTNDNGIGIYIWIGSTSLPSINNQRFDIETSDIDGEFPHYAFNNEKVVGKFTIVNQNVITITFATLYQPYLNIQNITCNKIQ
ncbi:hypothetical protein R4M03_06800 [Brachyspira pilosicoli]|uniref:Lipoprotein n=1 Tax=Brachyspira pilosicoli P43/6/78 TaxID=1042417 RepID=A0A3B6VIK0_BRAPL|nr:hypothetical protein [Brachyspira pilosicoli]AGA65618.1 hypothetical protein BPP43_01360 [Brachyspira pilosicoli P43/6/78]MBW5391918.1 hypothetical protein [Brachyspira pilosicoli]SUW07504.1 Uncharacterised protein [Brachyspira pilosicoli]